MRIIKFILIIILINIAIKLICTISYQQGYKQSIRDRIKVLKIEIDSIDIRSDSVNVSSFPDHTEIPYNNIKP